MGHRKVPIPYGTCQGLQGFCAPYGGQVCPCAWMLPPPRTPPAVYTRVSYGPATTVIWKVSLSPGSPASATVTTNCTGPRVLSPVPTIVLWQPGLKLVIDVLITRKPRS